MNEKLRVAERDKEHAHKVGPFGSVKGLITNPTVIPRDLQRSWPRLLSGTSALDQAVFNENLELFFPSHPGYIERIMDIYLFMNSKYDNLMKLKPVIVHVNYHPDKLPKMKAVFDFYVNGKKDALETFPDGTNW